MKVDIRKSIKTLQQAREIIAAVERKQAENAKLAAETQSDLERRLSGYVNFGAAVLDEEARIVMTLRTKLDVLTSLGPRLEKDHAAACQEAVKLVEQEQVVIIKVAGDLQRASIESIRERLSPLVRPDRVSQQKVEAFAEQFAAITVESEKALALTHPLAFLKSFRAVSLRFLDQTIAALEKAATEANT